MNTEEHDELWRLLGKAKKTEVSPFFARNVLREIRGQKPARSGLFLWASRQWRVALLTVSAVLLLGVGFAPSVFHKPSVNAARQSVAASQSTAQQTAPDYDAINHLDELLAYEENSIWLDNSSY